MEADMTPSVRFPTTQQFSPMSPFLSAGRQDRSPLTAAAVLPEQFFAHSSGTQTGIHALMQAILEDALACFQKQFETNTSRARRLGKEAEEWMLTDDHGWPFSFINICDALGLEPEYFRRHLKQSPFRSRLPVRRKSSHTVFPQRALKIAA